LRSSALQSPHDIPAADSRRSRRRRWGLPVLRVTYKEHENDVRLYWFFQDRTVELLKAAGALKVWTFPLDTYYPAVHLLGTCRMGTDPSRSVVDQSHRSHDVPSLFLVDDSSLVTGGRGQPTGTIQALAFRAGAEITRLARAGSWGGVDRRSSLAARA
jgi:choline dehydrogenase-like flavoprotein